MGKEFGLEWQNSRANRRSSETVPIDRTAEVRIYSHLFLEREKFIRGEGKPGALHSQKRASRLSATTPTSS
jgi:hypothetical protein